MKHLDWIRIAKFSDLFNTVFAFTVNDRNITFHNPYQYLEFLKTTPSPTITKNKCQLQALSKSTNVNKSQLFNKNAETHLNDLWKIWSWSYYLKHLTVHTQSKKIILFWTEANVQDTFLIFTFLTILAITAILVILAILVNLWYLQVSLH